jgi:hypothetical protein
MATIDLRYKLANEGSRIAQFGRHFAIALPVVLDQFFDVNQNGVLLQRVTANCILVGGAGSLALEMAYTLNNQPVISFIAAAIPGQEIRGPIKRVLSVSALGNTTATNLTWTSGE